MRFRKPPASSAGVRRSSRCSRAWNNAVIGVSGLADEAGDDLLVAGPVKGDLQLVAVDMNDDEDAEKKPELAMRALDKQASGPVALGDLEEVEACPVCFSYWSEPGVVKATTKCGHDFCAKCVVSVLAITPPAASGSCPLCRADVTLADITMELPTV